MTGFLPACRADPGRSIASVPVARELVQRGQEVRWYTGKVFQDKVTGTGARYEPMRAAHDFGGRTREEAFPEHVWLTGVEGMIAGFGAEFVSERTGIPVDERSEPPATPRLMPVANLWEVRPGVRGRRHTVTPT